jgi:hypothetical protein
MPARAGKRLDKARAPARPEPDAGRSSAVRRQLPWWPHDVAVPSVRCRGLRAKRGRWLPIVGRSRVQALSCAVPHLPARFGATWARTSVVSDRVAGPYPVGRLQPRPRNWARHETAGHDVAGDRACCRRLVARRERFVVRIGRGIGRRPLPGGVAVRTGGSAGRRPRRGGLTSSRVKHELSHLESLNSLRCPVGAAWPQHESLQHVGVRSPLRRDDSLGDNDWSPAKLSRIETVRRAGGAGRVVRVSCAGRPRYRLCAAFRHSSSQYGSTSASINCVQFSQ